MKENKKGLWVMLTIMLIAVIGVTVYMLATSSGSVKEKNYSDFTKDAIAGKVVKIEVVNDKATVTIKNGSATEKYYVYVPERDSLNSFLSENNLQDIEIKYNSRYTSGFWSYLPSLLLGVLLIFGLLYVVRAVNNANKPINDYSHAGAEESKEKVKFTDVAGADEEKEELKEVVDFLKDHKKFTEMGARIPRGVLMVGPPGTGKTLLAKAVAGEANVPFFSISGSDFVEMYVGVGASRVRDLFATAKRNKPCIIFIDEIDAVGRQRGAGLGGGHDEREQTLNQLLVQMDGFETSEGIIVMAATNRADILDPALLRPGRFDRQIHVNLPDIRGREEIFKVHARNKPMDPSVDFKVLARATSGFSGADIANLLNESAILCVRAGRTSITMEDIYEGIDKVVMGPQKKSRVVTEVDKRITAYHEAGHAIVAMSIKECDPVHEVTIIPRGNAAGFTMVRPENDNNHETVNSIKASLAMTMGGRAAEELVIGDYTTGACGDIRQATNVARQMVTEWGMSELGPVYYGSNHEVFLGRDYGSSHAYSEDMAAKIDSEVHRIVEEAHARAKSILTQNKDKMETLVRVLVECETVYDNEMRMIMDGKSAAEVIETLNLRYVRKDTNTNQKSGENKDENKEDK